jgi:integrase
MAERDEGLTSDAGNPTLGAFLDRWLSDSVRDSVRQQTLDSYAQQVQQHIRPALGRVKLKALSAAHIQRFYRMKLAQGLSPRTVQYLHVVLHRALKQAVRMKDILCRSATYANRCEISRQTPNWDL